METLDLDFDRALDRVLDLGERERVRAGTASCTARSRLLASAAGERARAYAERWHDPLKAARALESIYRDSKAPLILGQ